MFLDGTSNTEENRTNIAKLHNIVTLQRAPYIHTLYVQGVGTDRKVLGNLFGAGIDDRAKLAYRFIASKYKQERGDKIFVFGFSRGAYSARILAGLIHTAELPDLTAVSVASGSDEEERRAEAEMDLVDEIFRYYKGTASFTAKQEAIRKIEGYRPLSTGTKISFMGLFDSVAALSYRPGEEQDLARLSSQYEDQICSIEKVAHAMSLDDNRGRAFPPSPMKVSAIAAECAEVLALPEDERESAIGRIIGERVSEVWFAGAHADVGGGYYEEDELSGVPLNWMLRKMKSNPDAAALLPGDPYVYEDPFARSHIGEKALAKGRIYINRNRALGYYLEQFHRDHRTLHIHSSVLARRARIPRTCAEYDLSQQDPQPDRTPDVCYGGKPTPSFKGFGRCFEKVPFEGEYPSGGALYARFTLKFTCGYRESNLVIDEPGLYPVTE